MAKSLMAAGLDVKFPAEELGGGSEEEDLIFWIFAKIGDQAFGQCLTPAQHSLLWRSAC